MNTEALFIPLFRLVTVAESRTETIEDSWHMDLIEEIRQGDEDSFRLLVRKYQEHISSMMWRFSRNPETHEELVQDVFIEVYTSLNNYKPLAPFSHWLSRIATRVGYKFWKKQKKEKEQITVHIDELAFSKCISQPHDIGAGEASQMIFDLLAQLSEKNRLILTLRFVEGYSIAETAYISGMSKVMVKVQTFRARKQFKKLYEKLGGEAYAF